MRTDFSGTSITVDEGDTRFPTPARRSVRPHGGRVQRVRVREFVSLYPDQFRPSSVPIITEGEPAMHSSPARRAAKALTGLVIAAALVLAADQPGQAAATGEGETVKQIFRQKLPN